MEDLWEIIRRIPPGHASSYGEVGRALRYPASGFMVGRRMKQCPEGVPWWRVVGKDGRLPIAKQSPHLALEQERLLQAEGVVVEEHHVTTAHMLSHHDLIELK